MLAESAASDPAGAGIKSGDDESLVRVRLCLLGVARRGSLATEE
jgi:hypothetical protein